ncbi:hypothetical protein HOY80DRAFT_1000386 [Tuber brumale]|nr:hypothetical protein HOY80DRAFT_1000386 [Tuber brumale]
MGPALPDIIPQPDMPPTGIVRTPDPPRVSENSEMLHNPHMPEHTQTPNAPQVRGNPHTPDDAPVHDNQHTADLSGMSDDSPAAEVRTGEAGRGKDSATGEGNADLRWASEMEDDTGRQGEKCSCTNETDIGDSTLE